MLGVLGLAVFGVVRLGRTLEPRQRIVLVLVFAFALVWVAYKLVDSGILGRTTDGPNEHATYPQGDRTERMTGTNAATAAALPAPRNPL